MYCYNHCVLKRIALPAIAVCLALLCFSPAQSQQRKKRVTAPQPQTIVTQPKAAEDQRGTDQSPLIVKVAPVPKSEEDRANEATERQRIAEERAEEIRERERRAEAERKKEQSDADLNAYTAKLADYTEQLAFFTKWLFIATVVLGLATGGLLWFARKQSIDTKEIIKSTRDEFLATHRPRMRLKHAWLTDQTAWRLGGPLEINLDFVNIGSGTAYITWINYQSILLAKGERLPQRPPYDEAPPSGLRITRFGKEGVVHIINSGVTHPRQVCDGILSDSEVHDILWGKRTLCLIGTIEYWDKFAKHLRQTAFCRKLTYQQYPPASGDMGRFCVVKDPDYEYED
jgi:hypothetical protein